ncbi:type II secretion system F family protein [Loktanella sp. SALINAS62]|uniref:type II secretion system F family protein n=1 Tax=Loktanella sp. SALINAS62 TaxID=2706124 RepID=UPI001B8B2B1F|nr:type II secretion system F family protein [Loktanella sp. SALINAS62]MBS1301767.1 type II secretion system F family protein [Loktanella sp. SALINAS62]
MSDAMTPAFWLAFAGLAVALAALGALMRAEVLRARTATRLQRATGTGPQRRGRSHDGTPSASGAHLRRIVLLTGERLAAIMGGEARETAAELASAGYRGRDALLIYAFLKTVLPASAVILGGIWLWLDGPRGTAMILPGGLVVAVALALSKGVDIFIDQRRRARLARIRAGFPDMLELLVISSEAGLGPQPALHRVARELALTQPELARDVLQMVSEMSMTNDRRSAYDRFAARIPLPEVAVFLQTLDQSDTYGTPFARAMRTLIVEQRANRLMAVEEQAARLPVLMTLPLIFCIMPAVFVVLLGPAVLNIIDNIMSGG